MATPLCLIFAHSEIYYINHGDFINSADAAVALDKTVQSTDLFDESMQVKRRHFPVLSDLSAAKVDSMRAHGHAAAFLTHTLTAPTRRENTHRTTCPFRSYHPTMLNMQHASYSRKSIRFNLLSFSPLLLRLQRLKSLVRVRKLSDMWVCPAPTPQQQPL